MSENGGEGRNSFLGYWSHLLATRANGLSLANDTFSDDALDFPSSLGYPNSLPPRMRARILDRHVTSACGHLVSSLQLLYAHVARSFDVLFLQECQRAINRPPTLIT